MNKNKMSVLNKLITFLNDVTDEAEAIIDVAEVDATDIRLFMCSNTSKDGTLELDFNKNINNSITNKLFNIKMESGHLVDVPIYLPNHLFNQIDVSTRFKMNNDIYQIKQIEEFDSLEQEEATLTLIKD